jgi:hypothetical protein
VGLVKGYTAPKEEEQLVADIYLHFDSMMAFAEFVGLIIDKLGQVYDENGEFLGSVCQKCGSLKATDDQIWKMGWWLKAKGHDHADRCPMCYCEDNNSGTLV